ncbi:PilZ domain-containing protein, partial [Candidatus Omnitrophota bacterium]
QEKEANSQTIAHQQQELGQEHSQRQQLQNSLREKEQHIARLADDVVKMTKKIEDFESGIAGLQQEKEVNRETISRQSEELKQLSAQCASLRETLSENEQLLQELETIKQTLFEKVEGLELEVQGLEKEKSTDAETIARQTKELEHLHQERSQLKETAQENKQLVQQFQDENRKMEKNIKTLESGIETLRQDDEVNQGAISHQHEELNRLHAQNAELQAACLEFQESGQRMTDQIQELESTVSRLHKETDAEQEAISHQRQELEETIAKNSELFSTLKEKEQQIEQFQDSIQKLEQLKQKHESQLTETDAKEKTNNQIISSQHKEIAEATSLHAQIDTSLKEKEHQIQKLNEIQRSLEDTLQESQSQVEALQRQAQAQDLIIDEFKQASQAPRSQDKSETLKARMIKEAKLPDALLEQQVIAKPVLQKARLFQDKHSGNILQFLFVNREIDENKLVECLSVEFKAPYLPIGSYAITDEILSLVPSELVERYWALPVDKHEDTLVVAMVDPFDCTAIQKLEEASGCHVQTYVGLFFEISELIKRFYKVNIRGLDEEGNLVSPVFIKSDVYKGRERRRAVRFKTRIPLKIADDNLVVTATTDTMSWDGLSFQLDHELPMYSTLTVQLNMMGSENQTVSQLQVAAVAQVVRVTPIEDNGFMIGIKFLNIPQPELIAIIDEASGDYERKKKETLEKKQATDKNDFL